MLLVDPDLFTPEELPGGRPTLQPFMNQRDMLLHTVLASFAKELEQESEVPRLFAEHAAGLVMAYLERSVRRTRGGRIRLGRSSQQRFARVFDFIEEHLHLDDPNQVGPMVKRLVEKRESGVKALQACVDVLKTQLPVPIFCLGYSAGGMITLDYGRSDAKIAGIILCSALLKSAAQGKNTKIASPVLILLGTQDVVSPMSVVVDVIAEMDRAGNNFRFELYGQTHHAFDNPEAGMDPNARLVYSPASAKRARRAIAEFIAEATYPRGPEVRNSGTALNKL